MKKESQKIQKTFYTAFFKRFLDIFISLVAIIVLSPILLLLYLLNLLFMGFPAILKQPRPGKNNKIFYIYKFRSMTNKRDKQGNLLPDSQRITLWGKIMRKTSLDELPQLFNILSGKMSIIGFRPRLIKDVIFYDKDVFDSYTTTPGLTGPIQAYSRNENSWEEIFEIDKEYANNIKFKTDIKIFFKTFSTIFTKGGESHDNAEEDKKITRDYYYADYLLKSGKISKEQYDYGMALAKEITNGKQPLEYHPEILDANLFEKMKTLKHAILIIKNKKGEMLQVFDKKWNGHLFPNCKFDSNNANSEVENYLTKNLALNLDNCSYHYLTNKVHEKLSQSSQTMKTYNHYFYEVTIKKLPENMKTKEFSLNGVAYSWLSFKELESNLRIQEINSDIVKMVKNIYQK